MTRELITDGLNAAQLRAVEAVRGPVCILAGAGSGKTTTITRRIANQVHTGTFEASQILAVTFTDKAAGEMRSRLAALGAGEVAARTFHSAALAQLRHLAPDFSYDVLPSKTVPLRQLANSLPTPYRFRPAGDLATEIEWAKNRRLSPAVYLDNLKDHEPPIPADLMVGIFTRYESGKAERKLIDFEDLLELAIQMYDTDEWAREQFAARYAAITVDEYQDVNLLQETLLRAWVGERDDLCAVGDDYQSIYGFTGASPRYLLEMPQRYPRTVVVRLEDNYRSTPQVLDVANRMVPHLGGAEKVLRATRPDGPVPVVRGFKRTDAEIALVVARIRALHDAGVAYEDMAILSRVNFRSEDYEEVLARQEIPYRVQDGAFLNRRSAREILRTLQRSSATDISARVRTMADRAGYLAEPPDGLGDQELTRQNDLSRMIRLAEELDDGVRTGAEFAAAVEARFGSGEGVGVNLMTYHRAKGLEFEAVFLPRLEAGELPFKRAKSPQAIDEERRLFYVGITRARTHLFITWADEPRRKVSPFIGELRGVKERSKEKAVDPMTNNRKVPVIVAEVGLEVEMTGGFSGTIVGVDEEGATIELAGGAHLEVRFGDRISADGKSLPLAPPRNGARDALLEGLKAWRLERSRTDGVPAYVIFHDTTLAEIAARAPRSIEDLGEISGVGPVKLERYGPDLLQVINPG